MEPAGRVAALWRYPVKSMLGEPLERAVFGPRGILGDRGWAVADEETGHVLSAKRVEGLLGVRAVMRPGGPAIVLPDGNAVYVEHASEALSAFLGRPVRTVTPEPAARATIDGDENTFRSPAGTFFDGADVLLVTTATLRRLTELAPGSTFDARRFRPNVVVETEPSAEGPVERSWVDRTLVAGGASFQIFATCRRCVVTTHAQEELPRDKEVLRAVAREQDNIVGVYARVLEAGESSVGDVVSLR